MTQLESLSEIEELERKRCEVEKKKVELLALRSEYFDVEKRKVGRVSLVGRAACSQTLSSLPKAPRWLPIIYVVGP